MIEHMIQIILSGLFLYLLYQTFGSDIVSSKLKAFREMSQGKTTAEKIAQVKLVSDDPKDIEKFITANAKYLSDRLIKQLVARIELIKCERILSEDALRTRISNLPQEEDIESLASPAMRRVR